MLVGETQKTVAGKFGAVDYDSTSVIHFERTVAPAVMDAALWNA